MATVLTRGAIILVAAAVVSYLCGSIPFGVLFARARGVDLRATGSGNIGATNVARVLGKKLGAVVLLLDATKGALPVLLVRFVFAGHGPYLLPAVGLAAIAGHCFSPWLYFRGGKGVATSLGVMIAADPLVAALAVLIFALLFAVFRVVSLGSLVAAVAFPVMLWFFERPAPIVALGLGAACLIVVMHHANIARLWRGRESTLE